MTNLIDKAIARSINHTESAFINGNLADVSALVGEAEDYVIDNDGDIDAWGTDEDGDEWRVRLMLNYDDIAFESIARWTDGEYDRLTQGFVAFCWDLRTETLEALEGDREQLIDDLVYAAEQFDTPVRLDDEKLREAFVSLLDANGTELADAVRKSLTEAA